jgi:hypothetical protein
MLLCGRNSSAGGNDTLRLLRRACQAFGSKFLDKACPLNLPILFAPSLRLSNSSEHEVSAATLHFLTSVPRKSWWVSWERAADDGCSEKGCRVRETQCSSTFRSIPDTFLARNLVKIRASLEPFVRLLKLGPPHCVARLRVRLDLHRIAPFVEFAIPSQFVGPGSGRVAKFLKLATPQCVARFCVRLYFHRIAPFLGFVMLVQSVGPGSGGV